MMMRTSTKQSDEEIVEQIVAGDTEMFAEVIARYQKPLIVYTRRITFSQQAAEDVTQNTFIKSYQNLRGFDTSKKFSSWIYRIAHNEAVNYVRKHKREITTSEETWFDSKASERESVESAVDRKLSNELLASVLKELPLKYREPIVLHTLEGKSYEEVSDILRIPTATVGTRIRRGKSKLKAIIKAKGGING
jgi:RNA polymerase sigma-70 factor (ECF subfamily)